MRYRTLLTAILLSVLLTHSFSCKDLGYPRTVPSPELVSYAALPQQFSDSDYLLISGIVLDQPESILQDLLSRHFDVSEAWASSIAGCITVRPMAPQLIVRLHKRDARMAEFGFMRVTLAEPCWSYWKHYRF